MRVRAVIATAAAVVAVGALITAPAILLLFAGDAPEAAAVVPCSPTWSPVDPTDVDTDLDETQLRNVTAIVTTGRSLGVPDQGLVIAVAAAWVETGGVYNLPSRARPASLQVPHDTHPTAWAPSGIPPGDLDSVGLFQQRDAWGSIVDRMTPAVSVAMFFTGGRAGQSGLLDIPGWQDMGVGSAAQAVQVSAFPARYAERERIARAAVAAVTNGTTTEQECAPPAPAGAGEWVSPLAGGYALTSPFGWRTHPVTGIRKLHTGQDLGAPAGTPIYAAATGTVTRYDGSSGYGNLVVIDHGDGTSTWYAHQCAGCVAVTVGQQVMAGTRIGAVGTTGLSTGNHLHFEVRVGGVPIDPAPFLNERGVTW